MSSRWRRATLRICDLDYYEGMPMVTRPATTPECEPHEPWPSEYVASSDYADLMMETHGQRQCKGCGLWAIWEPKAPVNAAERACPAPEEEQ
jgi:hypothetical protein